MKQKTIIIFFVLFAYSQINFAQYFNECGLTNLNQSSLYSQTSINMMATTSTTTLPHTGNIKVFVVFAQFLDDPNTDNNGWARNTYPSWANDYINASAGGTYTWNNLSHYFNEMSNGNFQIIGDVYNSLVITDHNESYYSSIGEVNREIILEVDPTVNFAEYDNLNGSSPGSDGIVDFIMIIYRNATSSSWSYTAIAHLEVSQTITVDGKQIVTNSYLGGGVQQRSGYLGRDYSMYVSAHEIGHYLFGGGHISNSTNLCLMSGGPVWNGSRGMHSWERQFLGWTNYTDKSTDGSITMTDYMTTDQIYRIPGTSSEYFLIENRRKTSYHDCAGDVGFYVYRITGATTYPPTIDVLCSDGNWDFTIDVATQKLTKSTPNINGRDEINYNTTSGGVQYACYTPVYSENSAWGDNEDAFDLTFNNVLSPVSNPRITNNVSLNFSLEVTGTNTIQFYFNGNVYNGAPSKPQNLTVVANSSYHPYLTWNANTETDLSGYQVWRKQNAGGSWTLIGSPTTNSFTDNQVLTNLPYSDIFYKIRAKDSQNKYSVYSLEVNIKGTLNKANEEVSEENKIEELPMEYKLTQNYPNPFNPSTKIVYDIPKNNYVSLKIYNSIGKEVSELVNGYKQAGSYSETFDASNLPSGVYFYKLQAGDFIQSKKMLLIK